MRLLANLHKQNTSASPLLYYLIKRHSISRKKPHRSRQNRFQNAPKVHAEVLAHLRFVVIPTLAVGGAILVAIPGNLIIIMVNLNLVITLVIRIIIILIILEVDFNLTAGVLPHKLISRRHKAKTRGRDPLRNHTGADSTAVKMATRLNRLMCILMLLISYIGSIELDVVDY